MFIITILTELICWMIFSFILAGGYWFIASVVFMASTAPFLSLWRGLFIACVLIKLIVKVLSRPVSYFNTVGAEWDANTCYLNRAKLTEKDPRDPNNW